MRLRPLGATGARCWGVDMACKLHQVSYPGHIGRRPSVRSSGLVRCRSELLLLPCRQVFRLTTERDGQHSQQCSHRERGIEFIQRDRGFMDSIYLQDIPLDAFVFGRRALLSGTTACHRHDWDFLRS